MLGQMVAARYPDGRVTVWVVNPTRGSNCPGVAGSMQQPFRSIGRAVCAASILGFIPYCNLGPRLQDRPRTATRK